MILSACWNRDYLELSAISADVVFLGKSTNLCTCVFVNRRGGDILENELGDRL